METTRQAKISLPKIIGDLSLASVAVAVIAVTYLGLQRLTPQSATTLALKNTQVLGANTTSQKLLYVPAHDTTSFVAQSTFETGVKSSGTSTATFQLKPLENISYEFAPLTIKNSQNDFAKVRISPEFSVQGSYTSIEIIYDGSSFEIISSQGTVKPVELSIPGQSTSTVMIRLTPVVRIATPSTLTVDFTEVP